MRKIRFIKFLMIQFAAIGFTSALAAGPLAQEIRNCESMGGANGCIYRILSILDSRSPGGGTEVPTLAMGTYANSRGAQMLLGAVPSGGSQFAFQVYWGGFTYQLGCNEFGKCSGIAGSDISIIDRTSFTFVNEVYTLRRI